MTATMLHPVRPADASVAADDPGRRRARIAAALPAAFERGALSFHLQPQVDLRSGTIIGLEALLRWDDAVLGAVSPAEFVPIAEASGSIVEIGAWLFRAVCDQSVAWARAGLAPVRIAVNLSARQLADPDVARRFHGIVLETGADPSHLGVEVAESVLMADPLVARGVLLDLRAIGIEISLDNFGTSYSNLSALRSLPLDVLKIDRSLIHDVTAAPEDVSITRAVLLLARSLKLRVLAEGVETEGQLKLLIANGCELMQGFVFSPPQTPDAIGRMLGSGRCLPERLLARQERRRTLLIVDDEEHIVSSLRRLLRSSGYTIVTAGNGAEALAKLAEHEVDVVISDQRMPGMTGVELLRRVRELHPETVRIVLSGYTELQSITDAVNEGAIYKFLTKPWDDERLRAHVAEAFHRKEMADENARLSSDLRRVNVDLAQANERQEGLLRQQDERIGLEVHRALHAQDLLEHLPTSVVGIDVDGSVAFANRRARALFDPGTALLGMPADEVLPAEWCAVWRDPDGGRHRRVDVDGLPHLISAEPIRDRAPLARPPALDRARSRGLRPRPLRPPHDLHAMNDAIESALAEPTAAPVTPADAAGDALLHRFRASLREGRVHPLYLAVRHYRAAVAAVAARDAVAVAAA